MKFAKGLLRHLIDQLLLIDAVRYIIALVRFVCFAIVRRKLRTWDLQKGITASVAHDTIHHNLRGPRDLSVARSHYLSQPLSVIEQIESAATILSIGTRSESVLLNLSTHGFNLSGIRGVHLISYASRIELRDIQLMP